MGLGPHGGSKTALVVGEYELLEVKRVPLGRVGMMGLMKGVGGLMEWAWMIELIAEIWLTGWTRIAEVWLMRWTGMIELIAGMWLMRWSGMIDLIAGMWLMRWTGMIERKQVWADEVNRDDRMIELIAGSLSDGMGVDDITDSSGLANGDNIRVGLMEWAWMMELITEWGC